MSKCESVAGAGVGQGGGVMVGRDDFRRRMARFELAKARRLRDEGRHGRAAVALRRARLWRWDSLLHSPAVVAA